MNRDLSEFSVEELEEEIARRETLAHLFEVTNPEIVNQLYDLMINKEMRNHDFWVKQLAQSDLDDVWSNRLYHCSPGYLYGFAGEILTTALKEYTHHE